MLKRRTLLTEADIERIVHDAVLEMADELAPLILAEMIRREHRRPGKLVKHEKKGK